MENLSDDYVAQLLANEAKASATRQCSYGVQAFLPQRSVNNAPKPNTRFLRNIIKETDNHNAALRAKEEQEARIRLQDLRHNSRAASRSRSRERASRQDGDHSRKRRRLDEINIILSSRSKDHGRERTERDTEMKSHHERQRSHHRGNTPSGSEDEGDRSRRHRHSRHHRHRRHDCHRSDDDSQRTANGHRGKAHRRRSRSRSPRTKTGARDRHRSSRRDHKNPPSPLLGSNNHSNKTPHRKESHTTSHTSKHDDCDSDPLETLGLIGPAPAPPAPKIKSRGRGAFASPHTASSSAIDQHFTAAYDPTIDIAPDTADDGGEGDEWDQALEALKDRQKWQQNQAERMRQAGFTDGEIAKWERGKGVGSEGQGREEDVRWKGKGEGREWDRGKVLDADGGVQTEVEWGRLKGT